MKYSFPAFENGFIRAAAASPALRVADCTYNADQIIVVDHGRIAEQGTHTSLMERNGIYAKLIEMQSFD